MLYNPPFHNDYRTFNLLEYFDGSFTFSSFDYANHITFRYSCCVYYSTSWVIIHSILNDIPFHNDYSLSDDSWNDFNYDDFHDDCQNPHDFICHLSYNNFDSDDGDHPCSNDYLLCCDSDLLPSYNDDDYDNALIDPDTDYYHSSLFCDYSVPSSHAYIYSHTPLVAF